MSLLAAPAFASPELEFLRQRCEAQEARIRELEAKLGITHAPQAAAANTVKGTPLPSAQTTTDSETTPAANHSQYEVKSGDTIERIARKHDCRVAALMTLNRLKPNSIIRPGQKLQLPAKETPPSLPAVATVESKSAPKTATHQVAQGETFAAIARKHGMPLSELLAANPDVKPTALRTGQTINLGKNTVPEEKATLTSTATTTTITTHETVETSPGPDAPKPVKIQPVFIDREMTYQEFARNQGTTTLRLNELNGLDLTEGALLAKGSELLAPTTQY